VVDLEGKGKDAEQPETTTEHEEDFYQFMAERLITDPEAAARLFS
jgi:hypothetical protein